MKLATSKFLTAILFTVFALFLLSASLRSHAASVGRSSNNAEQSSNNRGSATLVCIVSRNDSEGAQGNMDAVVLVSNGRLSQPYPEYNDAAQARFAARYYVPGKRYRVTFGGGEVGTATVKSSDKGCNNIHAVATIEDGQKIPPHLSALVTDSELLGRKGSARRAPTAGERESIMKLVRQIYRARGTTPALLNTLKTTNLTATDLNGDGAFELIGSFVIETRSKARRDLVLIAEPRRLTPVQAVTPAGSSYKAALVHFQSYKLPPEGFDSAVDFVDQLDLDGDGMGEVFVQEHGFDAYGYSIYKKSPRGWRKVYTTTGDAC